MIPSIIIRRQTVDLILKVCRNEWIIGSLFNHNCFSMNMHCSKHYRYKQVITWISPYTKSQLLEIFLICVKLFTASFKTHPCSICALLLVYISWLPCMILFTKAHAMHICLFHQRASMTHWNILKGSSGSLNVDILWRACLSFRMGSFAVAMISGKGFFLSFCITSLVAGWSDQSY